MNDQALNISRNLKLSGQKIIVGQKIEAEAGIILDTHALVHINGVTNWESLNVNGVITGQVQF